MRKEAKELKEESKKDEYKSAKKNSMITLSMIFLILIFMIVLIFNAKGFKSDLSNEVVLKVNDEEVTLELFEYYLEKGKEYYEIEAGEDVWETVIDGKEAFSALKDDIADTIIDIKVQVSSAKKAGIIVEPSDFDKVTYNKEDLIEEEYVKDQLYIHKLKDFYYMQYILDEQEFEKYLEEKHISKELVTSEVKTDYIKTKSQEVYEKDLENWLLEKEVVVNDKIYSNILLQSFNNKY